MWERKQVRAGGREEGTKGEIWKDVERRNMEGKRGRWEDKGRNRERKEIPRKNRGQREKREMSR